MRPVVLDTDIGTDIDDTWALAMLLRSPEVDLRLVVTATGDTRYRAQLAAGILHAGGRADVPVGIGIPTTLRPEIPLRPQGRCAAEVDLNRHRGGVHADGVQALIDCVMTSDEPVTIIAIGPVTNIAAALKREPRIAERARLVGMLGSVHGTAFEPNEDPVAEYNVLCDVPACRAVFEAEWEKTITPLDTCAAIVLRGDHYQAVRASTSPLMQAVLANYDDWFESWADAQGQDWYDALRDLYSKLGDYGDPRTLRERSSTILFDTVAVYLGYDEAFLNVERLPIELTGDDGVMRITPQAPELRVATTWKAQHSFESHLIERLLA